MDSAPCGPCRADRLWLDERQSLFPRKRGSGFAVAAGKELWQTQFVAPAAYSFDSLSVNPGRTDGKPAYHIVFLEMLVWADQRLGPGLTSEKVCLSLRWATPCFGPELNS